MKIDRNGSVPIHTQIHAFLRDQILSNKLRSDDPVPSERELSDQLNVSRMTVRQAMNALRKEGLIYKKRGTGTFVSPLKLDIHTRNLNGFSEEMIRRSMRPASRVLELKRIPAGEDSAKQLNIPLGTEVYSLRRLRLADRIPMALETVTVPAEICPGLERFDFSRKSLYKVLEESYGVNFFSAAEDIEASISDEITSDLLQVDRRSPLLIVYRTVFVEDGSPVEFTHSIYRADRYRASFFLTKK